MFEVQEIKMLITRSMAPMKKSKVMPVNDLFMSWPDNCGLNTKDCRLKGGRTSRNHAYA